MSAKSKILILSFAVLLLFCANIIWGAVHIPVHRLYAILTGVETSGPMAFVVLNSRVPQAVTALLAGGALGVAGLVLQTTFRNPLAGPSVLGISSGASLGVALVILGFGLRGSAMQIGTGINLSVTAGALIGSLAVMGVLIILSMAVRGDLMLLIAGMMIGYLTSAIVSLLSSLATAQGIQGYVMWGLGTFGDVSNARLPFFATVTVLSLAATMMMAKPLDLLLLGDNYARNLGVNIKATRAGLLLCAGLLTGVVTAFCGPITFIGMSMPHLARFWLKSDSHRILLPASLLWGAIMALACNVVSTIPENSVLPINALTSVVGVPIIIWVMVRRR